MFEISSRINSTWGGNLVDMVRCHRFIDIIEEENLLENASRIGALLLEKLQRLADELPALVASPRGRGMLIAFDLPSTESRNQTLAAMMQERLIALPSGSRSIRFRPPLTLTADEAGEGILRCERALRSADSASGGSR